MQAPKIDKRTYQDIIEQTEELAQKYTKKKDNNGVGWQPDQQPGQMDAGGALIRIFGRFAEDVIERLNQVPEKNFLSFLNLIGTRITPPQLARVPLTFYLAASSPVNAFVPAGTQVAAPPTEAQAKEVIFETERDLVVTRSQLKAVYMYNPKTNTYSERTRQALGDEDEAFPIFKGEQSVEQHLYLACDSLLTLPGRKDVIFNIDEKSSANKLNDLTLTWAYWDGEKWLSLSNVKPSVNGKRWQVSMPNLPVLKQKMVNGVAAGWLRVTLNKWPNDKNALPVITDITTSVHNSRTDISPEWGFSNNLPLDLSMGFYPFGEQPRFNDTLYLACEEALAHAKAKITINVTLNSDYRAKPSDNLEMAWEAWNGTTWQELGRSIDFKKKTQAGSDDFSRSSPPNPPKTTEVVTTNQKEHTLAFTQGGTVKCTLPATTAPTTVNGELAYWLRIRIVRGNYGVGLSYKLKDDGSYEVVPATFAPPVVETIRFGYETEPVPLSACQLYHDFTYQDCKANAADADIIRIGEACPSDKRTDFQPFKPTSDTHPTLYLGVDQPFENRRITLYAQVKPPKVSRSDDFSRSSPPKTTEVVTTIRWEYASSNGNWTSLSVVDETQNFARSDLISFIGPKDFTDGERFGKKLYWLRACWHQGEFQGEPHLRRLLLNTTWASQGQTIQNEILGSSNGQAGQIFHTTQAPVLRDQQIEVRESQLDKVGQREEIWVRWHALPDFYDSGRHDRHYTFDHLTGEVRFGDGRQGMIPPLSRKNIRAARYRTGGGKAGNQPKGAIIELKSSVPYIDRVTNLEAASGGVEQEELARVKERGPKRLRHRERAVTPEDFEDLAREASPKVARAKAIFPRLESKKAEGAQTETTFPTFDGQKMVAGQIGLILVPDSEEPRPTPTLSLIRRVEKYLLERCVPTLDLWISGPKWVEVTVSATVVPTSSDKTDLAATVKEALARFLHPLTGGADGKGWPFGRKPHKSDLYALIQRVPGVDHVHTLKADEKLKSETLKAEPFLVSSGDHKISLG